jgi:hypothetical protein
MLALIVARLLQIIFTPRGTMEPKSSSFNSAVLSLVVTLKDGQKITTTGRETQIYSKESGGWRIVHVHYSGPPVIGALKGF